MGVRKQNIHKKITTIWEKTYVFTTIAFLRLGEINERLWYFFRHYCLSFLNKHKLRHSVFLYLLISEQVVFIAFQFKNFCYIIITGIQSCSIGIYLPPP